MFTSQERASLKRELVMLARSDVDVVGAAWVGSTARGAEDDWSDIDLAVQLAADADEQAVVDRWTRFLASTADAAVTFDVFAAGARYRVFLLRSSLQVDLSFWPHNAFRATEPSFTVIFGTPGTPESPAPSDLTDAFGYGWLYAVHARSAVARGRRFQALTMLGSLRDTVIALQCDIHGLDSSHGKGADRLPPRMLGRLEQLHPADLTPLELDRSRRGLTAALLDTIAAIDTDYAARLSGPFAVLAQPAI